jgi:hypothetical protein
MYHSTGVQKLSETQKSKLRNGHPVRIKKGSGNNLHLTDDQIKKLESAAKKGAAYTLTMHPEQAAKHKSGEGLFGDIAAKAKAFARKHKDLINPIIGRVRAGAKSGINKLASKANDKVDEYIKPIEGEGIIGDALKGLIGMTGLGVKPKTLKSTLKSLPTKKPRKGKGILSNIIKAVAPAVIDAAAGAVKGKVEGMGAKRKPGRPKKAPKSTTKKGPGRPRKNRSGGALFPAGNYGPSD